MAKKICFFNHKGGVSKTTSVYHIGWKLAEKGKKVLLVDGDPQCNLSSIFLMSNFYLYYENEATSKNNIMDGVATVFTGIPSPIIAIDCPQHQRNNNLYLLPGHMNLTEYDPQLTFAINSPATLPSMKNMPGAFNELIEKVSERYNIDFVLIDLNPSLSSINQILFLTSDAFIIPANPDVFCQMAINSLSKILPSWNSWKKSNISFFTDTTYPLPQGSPKFIGEIIQRFNVRNHSAANNYKPMIQAIKDLVTNVFSVHLKDNDMLFAQDFYQQAGIPNDLCLSEIPEFASLEQRYQKNGIPVYALNDVELDQDGIVLDQYKVKQQEINDLYNDLTSKILAIMQ